MEIPLFQVDAFTRRVFAGNPAAVCPLPEWPPDDLLQSVAAENNLSETAFVVDEDGEFSIRWLTPTQEVDLCGHATLAAAYVIFQFLDPSLGSVSFQSRSGVLKANRAENDRVAIDLPAREAEPCTAPALLLAGLARPPREVRAARDYLAIYDSEDEVRSLKPDMAKLMELDRQGVIVTAEGADCDFVSRYFAPAVGIPEDPVTGSSHCSLIPYWSKRLGKENLHARQVSARGGELYGTLRDGRVFLEGHAVLYLRGTIEL